MEYEKKDSLGLLYSADCAHCGWFWDDHDYPAFYGHQEGELPRPGCMVSIWDCKGFVIDESNIDNIVAVSAKRLFWEEVPIHEFMDNDDVASRVRALLEEKTSEWEQEKEEYSKRHQYDHVSGGSVMIAFIRGRSIVGRLE